VRALLDGSRERQRSRFLASRTDVKGERRVLRLDGKKALFASSGQRATVVDVIRRFAKQQPNPDMRAGRGAAHRRHGQPPRRQLRDPGRGQGLTRRNHVLDLKKALPSSLTAHLKLAQPKRKSETHRVVALQRRLQALSMAFLQPLILGGAAYVPRGLQRPEDRVALGQSGQSVNDLESAIAVMGRLVAWAQIRSALGAMGRRSPMN
jgi:uncharacterized protein (DUF2252 family)